MRKASSAYILFALMIVLTMLLSACKAKEVIKTIEVEKVVQQTVEVEKVVEKTVQVEKVVEKVVEVTPTAVPPTATAEPVEVGTEPTPSSWPWRHQQPARNSKPVDRLLRIS